MDSKDIMRISPSGVRSFRECAYAYARTYVSPLPERERVAVPALALGSAVHAAIARFHRRGAWARCGLDELVAMLAGVWEPHGFPDPRAEQEAYKRATELLVRFHAHPFLDGAVRELGVERNVTWRKPRRGMLATGRLDRVCLGPGGELVVVDYKCGMPPERAEVLQRDVQSVMYRGVAADAFRWLAPARIVIAFRYVGAAVTLEVEHDEVIFRDVWEDLVATVAEIRAARTRHTAGETLVDAFPLNRGPRCRSCQFAVHCDDLESTLVSAAASKEIA